MSPRKASWQDRSKNRKSSKTKTAAVGLAREVLAFSGIFVAFMLALMLFSYDPTDTSATYAAGKEGISNLAGYVGAFISSYIYYLFGYASYLLCLLLLFASLLLFRPKPVPFYIKTVKRLSALLLLFCICGLLTIHSSAELLPELPATAGGHVGIIIASNSISLLGLVGAKLALLFLALISLSLLTGLSWLQIFEVLGGLVMFLAYKLNIKKVMTLPLLPAKAALATMQNASNFLKRPRKLNPRMVFIPGKGIINKGPASATGDKPPRIEPRTTGKTAELPPSTPPTNIANNIEQPTSAVTESEPASQPSTQYKLPDSTLLDKADPGEIGVSEEDLETMGQTLVDTLKDFGISAKLLGFNPGPVVTMFEIEPAAGIKAVRISNLTNDLSRALALGNIRVAEFIRGKSCIGIEVPNRKRQTVNFRQLIESPEFKDNSCRLPMVLGQDISGKATIVDLANMPHLLVAGTTGSGKSMGINTMVLSLLLRYSPKEMRLIMVDPKMLELSSYDGIPNLLTPVITDMSLAAKSIGWCVHEMERRYKLMSEHGARNLESYNQDNQNNQKRQDKQDSGEAMPYLVLVIDEYADMIMTNRRVEEHIVRLAQKGRAAGIHIILATQRPSVDVITGLIKANIPARVSYKVSSRIDSRTILDQSGAEQLLGKGDMLYIGGGGEIPTRIHGSFVADADINRITGHCKQQGQPEYQEEVTADDPADNPEIAGGEEKDELYADAVSFVLEARRVSISAVQRKFKIGYNRAARIIESMEEEGIVSEMDNSGKRQVIG